MTVGISLLAIDPKRAEQLYFTTPYITIQGTLLVKEGNSLHSVAGMDQPGVVINVGKTPLTISGFRVICNTRPSTGYRHRRRRSTTFCKAKAIWRQEYANRWKKQPETAGYRVLADNFTEIQQAICVAKQHCVISIPWRVAGGVATRRFATAHHC